MNLALIIWGSLSTEESILLSTFVNQLINEIDEKEEKIFYVLTSKEMSHYFVCDEKLSLIVISENMEENKHDWDLLCKEGDLSAILIFDFEKIIFDHNSINFKLEWLIDLNIPIIIVDYIDVIHFNKDKIIELKDKEKFLKQESIKIPKFKNSYILKICPPCEVEPNLPSNILYWRFQNEFNFITRFNNKQKVRDSLCCEEDEKIILILLNMLQILKSIENNIQTHYQLLFETLIYYLWTLNFKARVLVLGIGDFLDPNTIENVKERIKFRFYPIINYDLYESLLQASDLLFLESEWHPSLITASLIDLPAIVLGNSLEVIDQEKGVLVGNFKEVAPNLFELLKTCSINFSEIFFPYINFPLKINKFPPTGLKTGKFIYQLVDTFDDEKTSMTIYNSIFNQKHIEKIIEEQRKYRDKSKGALSALKIIQKVLKKS